MEEQQDMDEKVKAIEDDRRKISELLLVLQGLREHVKQPATAPPRRTGRRGSRSTPYGLLSLRWRRRRRGARAGSSLAMRTSSTSRRSTRCPCSSMCRRCLSNSQRALMLAASGALARASRSVAVDVDEHEEGDQSDFERYQGFGLLEQKDADAENDTGLASSWDDDDMSELISPTYMSSEYAGPSPVSSLSSTTSSAAAAANDESHALASRGNSVSFSQSTAFVTRSQQ